MSRFASSIKNLLSFKSPLSSEKNEPNGDRASASPGDREEVRDNLFGSNSKSNNRRQPGDAREEEEEEDFIGDETQLPYPMMHYQESASPQRDNADQEEEEEEDDDDDVNNATDLGALNPDPLLFGGGEETQVTQAEFPTNRDDSFLDLPSAEEGNLSFQQDGSGAERAEAPPSPPPPPRPVLDEINADVADWICHVCLVQGDPTIVQADARALESLLRTSSVALTNEQAVRLAITSFYVNVCGVVLGGGKAAGQDDDDPPPDDDDGLESRDWGALDEQFAALSRQMAKFPDVSAATAGGIDRQAQDIGVLIKVQRSLSVLTRDMDQILKERPVSVRSEAEGVLNSHLQRLENVYKDPGRVPDALVVCSPDQAPTSSSGIAHVIHRVKQIVSEGDFSQGVLEQRVQTFLIDWVSKHLETPTLVKLGYRGVAPFKTALASSEDEIMAGDMSSLGDGFDTDEELLRLEDEEGGDDRRTRKLRQPQRRHRLRSTDTESKASERNGRRGEKDVMTSTTTDVRVKNRRSGRDLKSPRRRPNQSRAQQQPSRSQATGLSDSETDDGEPVYHHQRLKSNRAAAAKAAPESRKENDDERHDESSGDEDRPETQVPLAQIERTDSCGNSRSARSGSDNPDANPRRQEESQDDESAASDDVTEPKLNGFSAARIRPRKRKRRVDVFDSSDDEENKRPGSSRKKSRRNKEKGEKNTERTSRVDLARVVLPRTLPSSQRRLSDRLSFTSSDDGGGGGGGGRESPSGQGAPAHAVSGRTKNFFTEEEVQAIREGVARFGAGEWQKIKTNSDGRLLARSAVQIKDKYRNMVRTGQV